MIYFAQQGTDGAIKIGFTDYPMPVRLASLQAGSPEPLKCLGVHDGTKADEQTLHQQFREQHIRGEWFRPDKALTDYIDAKTHKPTVCKISSEPSAPKVRVNVMLDAEPLALLKQQLRAEDMTLSQVLRRMIAEYLELQEGV